LVAERLISMGSATKETILISGAGLGGSLMAIYLARAGHDVRVYERRDDPRAAARDRGRSINLAISTRGVHALSQVGLAEDVLSTAVPMRGRMIHDPAGRTRFQPYGTRKDQVINSVSRLGLNIALLDVAEREPDVQLVFGQRCVDVDLDAARLVLEETATGTQSTVEGDRIIGADGAFSAVRGRMERLERFDYQQNYLEHGYKELTIPAGPGGKFLMEPNALHIWPRGGYMMIALPNADGTFTCTLFWPFEGENSFAVLRDGDAVLDHFRRNFPDAVPLMPALREEYFANPVSSLVTVRTRPWYYRDRVVLLGDACHAVVPFYGQGANAAFEDCVVLDECIRKHAPNWGTAFATYDRQRRRHVNTLADLAIANFVEMRDHVSSRAFLIKKQCEKLLHRAFPAWFVPLYTMVTFSRTPYAEATARAERQWAVVRWTLVVLALLLILAVVIPVVT
jgi:kynurenine 3-monooxygenase